MNNEVYEDPVAAYEGSYHMGGYGGWHILLNPGHGPDNETDPGAVNAERGVTECDITSLVAERVGFYLQQAGCHVDLIKSDNLNYEADDLEPPSVVEVANKLDVDIFVSIHCNSFNGEARGCETLCYAIADENGNVTEDAILAYCVNRQIAGAIQAIDEDFPDRGVKERPNLIVLRDTEMTAVLTELGFIDSAPDCKLLETRYDDFARAVVRGITDYMSGIRR